MNYTTWFYSDYYPFLPEFLLLQKVEWKWLKRMYYMLFHWIQNAWPTARRVVQGLYRRFPMNYYSLEISQFAPENLPLQRKIVFQSSFFRGNLAVQLRGACSEPEVSSHLDCVGHANWKNRCFWYWTVALKKGLVIWSYWKILKHVLSSIDVVVYVFSLRMGMGKFLKYRPKPSKKLLALLATHCLESSPSRCGICFFSDGTHPKKSVILVTANY